MSKIAPIINCGSALALCFVLFTVSASAQAPATTPLLPATTTAEATATPATPSQPGTGQTPYGMPNAGMQPGMMGGAMPGGMSGMYGANMQPGAYGGAYGGGVDPEMQAFLNSRLQNLRTAETQINNDITMAGGEASPAARQLIMLRNQLQGQIRQLEQQLGINSMGTAGMGATGMPGAAMNSMPTNPMAAMMGAGMGSAMPNAYGMGTTPDAFGMAGMPGMGGSPNAMMLESLRQEAVFNLRDVQRTLSMLPPNDPMRAQLENQQAEWLKQVESLNKQLEQGNVDTAATGANALSPYTAGSTGSLAESVGLARERQARQFARQQAAMQGGAATNPRLLQMRDAERQLRAMGEIEAADMLRQQIEEQERAGAQFAEPQLGNMTQDNMTPPMPENMMMSSGMGMIPSTARVAAQPTTTDIVRQAEMLELQTTVESLRSEIASMREEIRSLEALLRQANQLPASEVPAPVSLGE